MFDRIEISDVLSEVKTEILALSASGLEVGRGTPAWQASRKALVLDADKLGHLKFYVREFDGESDPLTGLIVDGATEIRVGFVEFEIVFSFKVKEVNEAADLAKALEAARRLQAIIPGPRLTRSGTASPTVEYGDVGQWAIVRWRFRELIQSEGATYA